MKTHNPDNERVKRRYLVFLKEAKRQSEASLDAVTKALSRFEEFHHVPRLQSLPHQPSCRLQTPSSRTGQSTYRRAVV